MKLPEMVARWRDAWQSLDPVTIAELYAPKGTHMSAVVASRMKRPDGMLTGPAEIRAYAEATAAQLDSFQADILNVIAEETPSDGRASVEYWRTVNGDRTGRKRVVEIIEWSGDKITACRVFHF
ncbi:nuclear transport factor 2 family protein [Parvibaculum sp.]|uniref:nuclear transport factor 2 family protein n=1 Tax=Parvibaculum sp. TaxID=2024848 RepID=UPI002731C3B9|nr:nuclear transport factor 2 family protein [Parvibaculum sp.]MDP1628963.1 nuclear transport factor 2 family protein [Parvibaculum sp.]MDP2148360.1 nuclear transport factor 2 family protein [Parvibaculum sp.]MDP3329648.1 nuclear transport factor 2 family protein [Parvibaculum sp.]